MVGAYIATGLLMLVLGALGLVRRAMALVPMPIVMGMVAGIPILDIGAPFRVLIAGAAVSLLLERGDWQAQAATP